MSQEKQCSICEKSFVVCFAYQIKRTETELFHFCSQSCHERYLCSNEVRTCDICGTQFEMLYAYQQASIDGLTRTYCSNACRTQEMELVERRHQNIRRIAVLNQKGGTGKTTTSVNVAAGLAQAGKRVLLIDLDAQSNVAVSLGLAAPRTITDVLVHRAHPAECIINVGANFDALIGHTSLVSAETELARLNRGRNQVLSEQMRGITNYDFIILDCSPSLSVLNTNALTFADQVLIPVSCDYLSMVGVRRILRTINKMNELLLSHVEVLGVVPTFYGLSEKCTQDTMRSLLAYFQDKVFPPISVDPKLRQAPIHKKSIFEFAPESQGALDYRRLVQKVMMATATAKPHGSRTEQRRSGT